MIAIAPEGVHRVAIYPFIRCVGASKWNLEDIVEEQIGLAENEVSIAQVNFESVHRIAMRRRHGTVPNLGHNLAATN
jgi:hypothetical protein